MKCRKYLFAGTIILVLAAAVPTCALSDGSAFSLGMVPSVQVPFSIGGETIPYSTGLSIGIWGQYDFQQPSGFLLRSALDYYYDPYTSGNSLSLFALSLAGGYQLGFLSRFQLGAFAGGGYSYGFQNSTFASGGSFYAEAGVSAGMILTPELQLSLGGTCRLYTGLLSTASGFIGITYFITGQATRHELIQSSLPVSPELLKGFRTAPPGKGLSIERADLTPVFPVFRKFYDDHPVGTVVIRNNEMKPISDVTVNLFIKDYMNDPKSTPIGRIEAGGSKEVPVFALFNEHILDTTEATKASAEITVDYRMADANYRAARTDSVRLLDRNAMTWEDNRRAAAFITSKDPAVLTFAKNVSGIVRDCRIPGMNGKLLAAIALHEAISLHGIAYVVDPKSAYSEQSKNKTDADFLQFPRQTLQYKGGDCDDLSILNDALLESIGIESALVTVPGHIFIAFSLGMTPDDVRRSFSSTDDMIFRNNESWIPVEITNIKNGFMSAWRDGAKEWREASTKGETGFYPVREAWAIYESVGLPGSSPELVMPPGDAIRASFRAEVEKLVNAELGPQVARLETALKIARDAEAVRNKLGVLYARYGKHDRAAAEFKKALEQKEYLPALVNLGNLSFLGSNWPDARTYYERAARLDPLNAKVILGMARAAFELEDYETSARQYGYFKKLNPELATQYAYLEGKSGDATRAADISAIKESVEWEEQD